MVAGNAAVLSRMWRGGIGTVSPIMGLTALARIVNHPAETPQVAIPSGFVYNEKTSVHDLWFHGTCLLRLCLGWRTSKVCEGVTRTVDGEYVARQLFTTELGQTIAYQWWYHLLERELPFSRWRPSPSCGQCF